MDALKQRIEIESGVAADDEFAIENKRVRGKHLQIVDHLRKIACKRLSGLGLQNDLITGAKSQTAESIPFRFVQPTGASGNLFHSFGFRGRIRWLDGQVNFGK